jgi:hypothetical protein
MLIWPSFSLFQTHLVSHSFSSRAKEWIVTYGINCCIELVSYNVQFCVGELSP